MEEKDKNPRGGEMGEKSIISYLHKKNRQNLINDEQAGLHAVGGERDTDEEKRMERKRESSVGCRDEVELDFHMDKFTQGF